MATSWKPVLQPWIRDLLLGLEPGEGSGLEEKREGLGQLLEVIGEAEPGGSLKLPDGEAAAILLVTDGTHSVHCLVTPEALSMAAWEEKHFGFRRAVGRLLLLQDFRVCVQEAAETSVPAQQNGKFYLWVHRFILLPTELPREGVTSCNWDPAVQRKLQECKKHHERERTPPNIDRGSTLSQLLEEMCEDRLSLLSCQAQSCLELGGSQGGSLPLTRWGASRRRAQGEAVFVVPGLRLHISAEEEDTLQNLRAVSENSPELQSLERTPADPWQLLPALSLTQSSSSSSYVEALDCLPFSTEGSPSRLKDNVTNNRESPSSGCREPIDLSPLLFQGGGSSCIQTSCPQEPPQDQLPPPLPSSSQAAASMSRDKWETPSTGGHQQPLGALLRARARARGSKDRPGNRKASLEFVSKRVKGPLWVPESTPSGDSSPGEGPASARAPPERHLDDSPFQYNYPEPCVRLCSQVAATRLCPSLLDWARQVLMESDLVEV
ncbi:adrenocortical dysplasia protein homolog isoform X2 [Vombatus ursinus]|uniref:Shelterin complex subunit TPP1/Est3 domain-containing protein n=1 Tax=Vombatus ursinus TaxID=29139 RepID=A0A4X2M345_VOMUR|nr:adrenocortical dysplasia protein homolog isoform X2 [Vombatus ursinus]